MVVSLNQRSVEFSFLYTTRSSSDLTFKQSGQVENFRIADPRGLAAPLPRSRKPLSERRFPQHSVRGSTLTRQGWIISGLHLGRVTTLPSCVLQQT